MNLLEEIKEDLKEAMKARDELRLATLRLVISRIKNQEIENKGSLTDKEVMALLRRERKQRLDSIDAYRKANREILVTRENEELKIIENYLPAAISEDECCKLVDKAVSEIPIGTNNFGKIVGRVIALSNGQADGALVAKIVKERING